MSKEYISKDSLIQRCLAIKAIAQREIDEWLTHTLEYREKVDCTKAMQRKQEMDDLLLWLNYEPTITISE